MPSASSRHQIGCALVGVGLLLVSAAAEARHRGRSIHTRPAHTVHFFDLPVIQCVAFAKQDAGINIAGNARDWWSNAAGVYERGNRPETGSVLSFQESGRMPLGHVAVVSGVQDSRTIIIDQSHWNSRGITRDVVVKDVSDENDWSAVRVQLGRSEGFGAIYSTHGFIYSRPDPQFSPTDDHVKPGRNVIIAKIKTHQVQGHARITTELAELSTTSRALDLTIGGISQDAPNRALR